MSEENQTPEVDYEKEARLQNWVPQEDFRGPKEDWIPAKDFVERGKQINPILRANNERLMREIEKQKKQMEELRAATEEFKEFQKKAFEKKAETLTAEIEALREEKRKAISAGDGNKAVEIDDKIDALKDEKAQAAQDAKEKPAPQKQEPQADPDLEKWVGENSWYKLDSAMAEVANAEAQKINRLYPDLRGKAFLDELDTRLEETFNPEKLGRKTKKTPRNPVEGATRTAPTRDSGERTFDDLPADAKAAYHRFVKQGIKVTKEGYVADYDWS
jgi:DNA repair exonuclease SbcCD ATPase subunit